MSTDFTVGDTLRYTVALSNQGTADLTATSFTDTPDPSTTLIAGSVTSSAGQVILGNGGGDSSVEVSVGVVSPGATVTITFDVTLDSLPSTGFVRNQGTTTSTELPDEPTDDPDTPGNDDPTDTPVAGDFQSSTRPKRICWSSTRTATASPDRATR